MTCFAVLSGNPRAWLALAALLLAVPLAAQPSLAEALAGDWTLIDETPALLHPSNPEQFSIIRVAPGESQWADGVFILKWPDESRPERGYYSSKSGRIWFTTYRWVNQKRERVEYRGVLETDGEVTWEGMAATTGGTKTTWSFVATRQ